MIKLGQLNLYWNHVTLQDDQLFLFLFMTLGS